MQAACLSFLILSGIAALVYQVTWVRLLGLSVGSTSASVATVLAAFFLGMSLGSVLAKHFVRQRVATLLPYVVLEALIGLAGIALLPVLLNLDAVMAAVPLLGEHLAFKFLVALAVLVVPSLCIGATFPVMANILIRRRDEIGLRFGQLYSLNTLGAVLGAGLSGFVIIPALGLDGAVYLAAGINFLIVAAGLALIKTTPLGRPYQAPEAGEPPAASDGAPTAPPFAGWALAVLFVTGLTSIAAEVGYTKYAAVFAGTTIYGFSAILAIFLVGITLGSWLIRRRIERIARPHLWVAWGMVLLALSLALTRSGLNLLPELHHHLKQSVLLPAWQVWGMRAGALFLVLVVPTTLFGALFPLNLRLYCGDLAGVPARTGRGYAVNTVGGILGSVLAGFVIIPWLGTDALLLGTAALMLLAALPLMKAVTGRARGALVAGAVAALAGLVALPPLDYKPMIAARLSLPDGVSYPFLKEGRSSVVSVTVADGLNAVLANNGLQESSVSLENPSFGPLVGVLLGAVPYLLHPDPKSAFQVGFGGGITTFTLTTTDLESIHVVELDPVVVQAVRSLHKGPVPALRDPRVRLTIDDARHRLLLEPTTYDLIICQPSHPWRAGSANVFTREFDQLVAARLNPGGIATQWVNLFHMDRATLGSIMNAFFGTFPHGAVFGNLGRKGAAILMVGSNRPLAFDPARTARHLAVPSLARGQVPEFVPTPNDLFRYYLLSRDEALALGAGQPPNTDTNILSEVRLARLLRTPEGAENPARAVVAHAGYDVAPYLEEPRAETLYRFGRAYVQKGHDDMAARVEERLTPLDPARARQLRHERLIDASRYPEAIDLYLGHADWPDAVHARQARVFAELNDMARAGEAVARMGDGEAKRLTQARLRFAARRWSGLEADAPRGRWLRHEWLVQGYYFDEATALYHQYGEWLDVAHQSQARIYMEAGHLVEAEAAIRKIRSAPARRLAELRLLFFARRWDALAAFPAETPAERVWQLVARFPDDPAAAAAEMVRLGREDPTLLDLPQLRLLNAYQKLNPDSAVARFDASARLNRRIASESRHLVLLAQDARRNGDMERARLLLSKLEVLAGPDSSAAHTARRALLPGEG